jgi:predicted enzyme related to lactoylglutathione lyase
MARVVHFEIPTDDPEQAAGFYSDVFGWRVDKWEGPIEYWLVTTGEESEPGINGAILKKDSPETVFTNIIEVPSLDETLEKITAAGGSVVAPKIPVPGMGWAAYFKDIDGNTLGLMQPDTSAT